MLGAILAGASLIGKLFGKTAENRASARVAESGLNQKADAATQLKANNDAINARANVATDTDYRNNQTRAAVSGGLLAGLKDAQFTRPDGVPSRAMTGGLRPSAITGGPEMGAQFQRDAMARYMAGPQGLHGDSPALTPLPQAGKFDKFLNIVGGIGNLASLGSSVAGQFGAGGVPDGVTNIEGAAPTADILGSGLGADAFQVPIPSDLNGLMQSKLKPINFGGR